MSRWQGVRVDGEYGRWHRRFWQCKLWKGLLCHWQRRRHEQSHLSTQVSQCNQLIKSWTTYVVLHRPVSELVCKYLQEFSTPPSLFTPCIVRKVIWRDSSQTILKNIRPWPWICGRRDYCWWVCLWLLLNCRRVSYLLRDFDERHIRRDWLTRSSRKQLDNSWWWRQWAGGGDRKHEMIC